MWFPAATSHYLFPVRNGTSKRGQVKRVTFSVHIAVSSSAPSWILLLIWTSTVLCVDFTAKTQTVHGTFVGLLPRLNGHVTPSRSTVLWRSLRVRFVINPLRGRTRLSGTPSLSMKTKILGTTARCVTAVVKNHKKKIISINSDLKKKKK